MVSVDQIKNGVAKYIDTEIIPALPGWKKWVFGGGAVLMLSNQQVIDMVFNNQMVKALGIITDSGMVDIDKVHTAIMPQIQKTGAIDIDIPMIGTIKIGASDVDTLYRMIVGG
jgi:hypothetical protein